MSDDEAGELWCPKCGTVMYADAVRCRACGDYVTPGAMPRGSMPAWMWIGLALVAAGLLTLLFAR